MLRHLQVRDFAIIDRVEVEFAPGMTVLTGETGAGKSILVDALGLVLGERGGSQLVREGAKRAEFSAEFDISALGHVAAWLEEQALDQDTDCLLRRVVNSDGRSRAFINGNAATMQQLKSLGERLLDIHGQHFHQSLLRKDIQRELLDHHGKLTALRRDVETAHAHWQELHERLVALQSADTDRASRLDLLRFQLDELDALKIADGEAGELLVERQKLLHSGKLAEGVATALSRLSDADQAGATELLGDAGRAIDTLLDFDSDLAPVAELLESASIQVAEATDALLRYAESLDMDPERRDWVESRLDALQNIARKHRIEIEAIPALQERVRQELAELGNAEQRGEELREQLAAAENRYDELAMQLSTARARAAKKFSAAVSGAMSGLGMPGGVFELSLSRREPGDRRPWGIDDIDFLISANPGQTPMPLSRVASGGELSRMSLAIQVIASDGSQIPTMVFDEVDAGVGGRVAEMVGRRLRELGGDRQVLCVTHLPQVACLADTHFRINKVTDGKATRTGVQLLSKEERVEEIARMLGGVEITQKTLEHAAEMLAGADRKLA